MKPFPGERQGKTRPVGGISLAMRRQIVQLHRQDASSNIAAPVRSTLIRRWDLVDPV
jgi:hypothetical protein